MQLLHSGELDEILLLYEFQESGHGGANSRNGREGESLAERACFGLLLHAYVPCCIACAAALRSVVTQT